MADHRGENERKGEGFVGIIPVVPLRSEGLDHLGHENLLDPAVAIDSGQKSVILTANLSALDIAGAKVWSGSCTKLSPVREVLAFPVVWVPSSDIDSLLILNI